MKGGTRERRDGGAKRTTETASARGERIGSRDTVGGDARGNGRGIGGVATSFLSVVAITALKRETERLRVRARRTERGRVRLMTLYSANFGTALENFSLAVFRGKLGEFPT